LSFVPKVISKNWQLKVSALAMAVLLWTVPRFDAQGSRVLDDVPVRVQLTDPNWALVGEPSPAEVSVTLSGPARELIAIGVDDPPLVIPLDEVATEDTTVRLRTSWFLGTGRDGVLVEDIRPGAVQVALERIQERRLPVALPVFGALTQGRSVAGPAEINPGVVTVFGPTSRFEGMDSVPLSPLDLARVQDGDSVTLLVDTAGLPGLQVLPLQATVTIPTEATSTREFADLPIRLPALETAPPLQARPARVTVLLVGARSLVNGVDPASLTVTIPPALASLAPGQEESVVLVVEGVPEFVEVHVNPDWVLLRRPVGQ
jgi:YbbR domain-containing protein